MTTSKTQIVITDGGRAAAGFKGSTGDCVTRAIAIATGMDYKSVYDMVNNAIARSQPSKAGKPKHSARLGVPKNITKLMMKELGWQWTPTMKVGQGCQTHLCRDELPKGRLIAAVSRHVVAVIDGVIHDSHDSSRGGTRCVYGYWSAPNIN